MERVYTWEGPVQLETPFSLILLNPLETETRTRVGTKFWI